MTDFDHDAPSPKGLHPLGRLNHLPLGALVAAALVAITLTAPYALILFGLAYGLEWLAATGISDWLLGTIGLSALALAVVLPVVVEGGLALQGRGLIASTYRAVSRRAADRSVGPS